LGQRLIAIKKMNAGIAAGNEVESHFFRPL
jgi:hypothetical protein